MHALTHTHTRTHTQGCYPALRKTGILHSRQHGGPSGHPVESVRQRQTNTV